MNRFHSLVHLIWITALVSPLSVYGQGDQFQPEQRANLHGGLVVQIGATSSEFATRLSLNERYLVHILDSDRQAIEKARQHIRDHGTYGFAWAEHRRDMEQLPYASNLVNLVVIQTKQVPLTEVLRILTPDGHVVFADKQLTTKALLESAGFESITTVDDRVAARKPWPKAMDGWSHPRHASDGNAVSNDTMVGPPERVRWIAAATSEVEGMVSAGGRNFYGGVLARDSFNGLRLWHRTLARRGDNNPKQFSLPRLAANSARPIASDQLLFAVLQDRPVALDAQSGEIVVEFGEMTKPTALIHDGTRVIAADASSVRGFSIETGKEIWKFEATEPRNVVGNGKILSFLQGRVRRGELAEAVTLDAATGDSLWRLDHYPWLRQVTRTVLARDHLAFEVSTLNDNDADNAIHVVSSTTGDHSWSKEFAPGMNHRRQARAMFLEDDLWILHGGKINTDDKEKMKRVPIQVSALNPANGEVRVTYPAGLTHCFPPVATPNFMFAGELDLTNLKSGEVIANRITKANCSRENGWVPANGLVYTTPKHCTCWPMLRGFVAMAPAPREESAATLPVEDIDFLFERGSVVPDPKAPRASNTDWPLYRHDRWRTASTTSAGPTNVNQKWSVALQPENDPENKRPGAIRHDWNENPVVKGPVSAPTIANGMAFVTRPDAHELIAIETSTGEVSWRFTANGRLDTPPAIYRGLCLFGSATGWVHALRADSGELVWKMRAAPTDERIVAYGQVESPWPVPGAILVIDDIAYFAAGRQPLADGGILLFAVDPLTGNRHWVRRIDSVPQKGFYENSGLEFDPFDILHAEGDGLAMSRWVMSLDGKQMAVDKWNAFAKLNTGKGDVWIPRGSWTYGARHQHRFPGEAPRRPLIAFRDDNIYSSLNGTTALFRRDFDLEKGEKFDSKWITGWKASQTARKDGKPYRTYRIAEGSLWTSDPYADPAKEAVAPKPRAQLANKIHAMALDGTGKLYVVHQDGRLKVVSVADGRLISESEVPSPAWDGLAIAEGCLFLTTQRGRLVCLGTK